MNEKRKAFPNFFAAEGIYWQEEGWDMDEKAVWQRVLSPGPENREDCGALLWEAEEMNGIYHGLRHRGAAAVELARNQQTAVELLRGICCLQGMPKRRRNAPAPPPGGTEALLRSCYHRSRRAMAEFAARAALPETGTVFAELAELQRKNCVLLARLLGSHTASG